MSRGNKPMKEKLKTRRLAYYITDHGFGHAVRSLEVIRHFLQRSPHTEIIVVSKIPEFLIKENVAASIPMRRRSLDIGLVQKDSIKFDLEATLRALQALYDNQDILVADEVDFLETRSIQGIVCDIPFLPFTAAFRLRIPSIGISNFTWDWIYQAYANSDPRWHPLVDWIRESYQKCTLLLQLPMHGDCTACPTIEDVPLIARRAKRTREETREILGLESEDKTYLISAVALDLDEKAELRLRNMSDIVFLYKRPLKFSFGICLDDYPVSYADVVAAVDGVVTKPGYGIVSECLVNSTPIIYTDRGAFPEYDILVQKMTKYLPTSYISSSDLYAAHWESAIQDLEKQPRRIPAIQANGAEVCARRILNYFDRL